ncbi:putative spermatogenesis-associated protein 31C2 [Glossophaga mutica]
MSRGEFSQLKKPMFGHVEKGLCKKPSHRSASSEAEVAELEEKSVFESHLGRLLDKGNLCQCSCRDAPGEAHKAAATGAHQPCHDPVGEAASGITTSASPAPLTECPTPLACTGSPGPTTSSVSVLSLAPLSASQPSGPFLPLGILSPQPLALSHSPSCAPDSEAHRAPPTSSPAPPPPESASPKAAASGLSLSSGPISALSCCQAAAKAMCLPTSSQRESPQERLSHRPPEVSFLGDPTDRQVASDQASLVNPHVQKTLEILTTNKAEVGMWREEEKNEGSESHLNSEQDTDEGASHPCSPVSTVPGDLMSPDVWEQMEQHLQNRFLLQQQEHWGVLPHSTQLSLQLRLPDGQLPGVGQAQGGQGPRQLSAFMGKSSQDAEKMRSSCPARIPPRTGLGMDVGHSEGRSLKHLCSGSASLPGKGLGVSCEESGKDLMGPWTSGPDKNVPRVHLGRTVGQVSEDQVPVDGHPPKLAASLPGKSTVHRETKDPASPKDLEPCMNTCPELSPLSARTQQVLEAHIRKFQVRHRWGLPLRILKPIQAFKLTRAQRSTLLQSLGTCSAICVSRALLNANFAKFVDKPVHSLPKEDVRAESLVLTLVGPLPVPSLAREEIQSALGRTPTGNCLGPSVAPLTRQEGRLPSPSLTYTSEGRKWHRETATVAEEGSREPTPSLVVAKNEPTGESAGWTSENFLQGMTILELNSESQSSTAQVSREAKEAPAWEVTLEPRVPASSQAINIDVRRSGSPRPSKRLSPPTKLVAPVPEEPRLNAQLSEFELRGFLKSGNQPQGRATGVLLEDCEMGTILQDSAIDVLLRDCNFDMLLAADILASHESLFGSQRVSDGDMSASQVLHDLKTSGGNHPQESLRLQDQYKRQSESVDEKEDNGKPDPGEHREGLAGLRASRASGMCTAQDKKLVGSLRSKSCQHEQKGQVPPENLFKKGMRCFLQWIHPRKGKGLNDPPQKGTPAPAPAQSWEPGQSRSLADNRAAEAQVLMTAVRQSLEEKLALHHGLRASQSHWRRGELQAPVGPHLCRQRVLCFEEQRRMMRGKADGRQATPSGHNCSNKCGWTTNRDSEGAFPPRDPGCPGVASRVGAAVTELPRPMGGVGLREECALGPQELKRVWHTEETLPGCCLVLVGDQEVISGSGGNWTRTPQSYQEKRHRRMGMLTEQQETGRNTVHHCVLP